MRVRAHVIFLLYHKKIGYSEENNMYVAAWIGTAAADGPSLTSTDFRCVTGDGGAENDGSYRPQEANLWVVDSGWRHSRGRGPR